MSSSEQEHSEKNDIDNETSSSLAPLPESMAPMPSINSNAGAPSLNATPFSFAISRRGMHGPTFPYMNTTVRSQPATTAVSPSRRRRQQQPIQQGRRMPATQQQGALSPWSLDYNQISSSITSMETTLAIGRQAMGQSSRNDAESLALSSTALPNEAERSRRQESLINEPASHDEIPESTSIQATTQQLVPQTRVLDESLDSHDEAITRIGTKQGLSVGEESKENVVNRSISTPTRTRTHSSATFHRLSSGKKRKQRTFMPSVAAEQDSEDDDAGSESIRQRHRSC